LSTEISCRAAIALKDNCFVFCVGRWHTGHFVIAAGIKAPAANRKQECDSQNSHAQSIPFDERFAESLVRPTVLPIARAARSLRGSIVVSPLAPHAMGYQQVGLQ
jgi:hypothetical protein